MQETIRLGLLAPLTGLVEMHGREIVLAARIACEEINDRGGLLGRPLELVVEDDGSLPDTAVPAARSLLDEHGCVALIGNLMSNSRIAVATQVAEPRRIPLLNFASYEGSIASRYFFHFAALPNQQIDPVIPFMAQRFGPKMFFAGSNYEWPRGSIDAAKRILRRIHGDVIGEEYLPLGANMAAIDELLAEVAHSGADVFMPCFSGADQIALLSRAGELGLKERMAVFVGNFDEIMASRLAPQARDGLFSSSTYFMSLESAENRRHLDRLARMPGVRGLWPQGNGILSAFGAGVCLCVRAFADAVMAAGSVAAEDLVYALEQVCVAGPQGLVEMDARSHHVAVDAYLARCNAAGSFAIVKRFGHKRPEIPERYRSHLPGEPPQEAAPTPATAARLAAEVSTARHKDESARNILSIADMAIIATNLDGIITEANRGACEMFGYEGSELVGMSVHLLVPPHFRQQHAMVLQQFAHGRQTERLMSARKEISGYRKDGSLIPLEASIAKSGQGDDLLLVVTLRDISERKQAQEDLTRRASHDPLTGLPNRALVRERLGSALQRSRRTGLSVALLFVDLDGFKLVNDTHGHEAGDRLLKTVAARLLAQVRPGDTVARLAADEFLILCDQLEQPATISGLAARINETLRQPIEFGGQPLFVTASIGVAIGNGSIHSADDLLRHADTAMYAVKAKGRDGWQFFSESLQEQARQRLAIANGLRLAIEREELSTRFQPIVAAESAQIVGAELLLRWKPAEGEISPALFIPIAEMTGAIVPIGNWVFRQACLSEVAWRRRWGDKAPYVSVNLSTRQLCEDGLVEQFAAILAETAADPERLLLEITETSLMAEVDSNLRILRRLADLGLRVAVDDFGTGYSSLAYLSRLPADVLKIDRAFIDGIGKSQEDRTIIRAVIGLGRGLKLKLVAEGVESAAQHQELCSYGCDLIQGYYFYPPMSAADFVELKERLEPETSRAAGASLYFLIYVSRATGPMPPTELAALQQQCSNFNRSVGISGCLLYENGQFMQMLEGREEVVLALMEGIGRDRRHEGVRVVIQGPARQRMFPDWGMLCKGFEDIEGLPDFAPWQKRQINFMDLADDAKACYMHLLAHSGRRP